LHWRIIAKDCFKKGTLYLNLTPTVDEYDDIRFVNHKDLFPEGADVVEDLTPYIKEYREKMEKLNKEIEH
jgi:isopentenyldiphosphate isomerase